MQNIALSWQQGAGLAAGLFAAGLALSASGRPRLVRLGPFAREAGFIAGLYALWQLAASATVMGTGGAYARGRWIEQFERDAHLPLERSAQQLITPHAWLTQACNLYYATMHFAALGALLVWLFVRHRDRYPPVRTTIVLLTAACLLIQLVPVAPPRLLPELGYVDTAEKYGQSVYTAFQAVGPDQLSAMPSVHVGWAVLVGVVVVRVSSSPWRWPVLLHPAITIFVVAATANHFWLDGIVAIALLALAMTGQWAARHAYAAWQRRAEPLTPLPEPEAEPEPLAVID